MRRVVVTGLGLVTPLGTGVASSWSRLIEGQSGIQKIDRFDVSDLPSKIAGLVPTGDGDHEFRATDFVEVKDARKNSLFINYAIAAAKEAIEDSGLDLSNEAQQVRTGVQIGSGIGGLPEIYDTSITLAERGPRRVSPFFIPSALINLASGQVSIRFHLKGPNVSAVTACATGAHAIGDAARLVALGDADAMVAGGSEAAMCRLTVAGFASARALSTGYNETPERASRPWDKGRDGFILGEGAGVVVLEDYERAKKRGAKIYAELLGYGLSGDAHHVTAPSPNGDGAYRAMKQALKAAAIDPGDIDYVNAHGTSTPLGDEIEAGAVMRLFGSAMGSVSMSSTKSAIGHLLGAAGSVEAIFSVLALQNGIAPPTLNLDDPDDVCKDIDLVPHRAKERKISAVLSNAFGFGGTNASLIFASADR